MYNSYPRGKFMKFTHNRIYKIHKILNIYKSYDGMNQTKTNQANKKRAQYA